MELENYRFIIEKLLKERKVSQRETDIFLDNLNLYINSGIEIEDDNAKIFEYDKEKIYKQAIKFIMKDFDRMDLISSEKPKFVILELSKECNLKCIMCGKKNETEMLGRFMSIDNFKTIIETLKDNLKRIRISGYGEFIMNPNADKILSYLEENKFGFDIEVISNGTIFRQSVRENILKLGGEVMISFDGYDKNSFEYIRAGANFENVCRNITKIVKINKDLRNPDKNIFFIITYQEENIEYLSKIVELAKSLGIGSVIFNQIRSYSFNEKLKDHTYFSYFAKHLGDAVKLCIQLGIIPYVGDHINGTEINYGNNNKKTSLTGGCEASTTEILIGYNGDIELCNRHCPYYIDNIFENDFMSIRNSLSYRFIRGFNNTENNHSYCKNCTFIKRYDFYQKT